MHPMQDQMRSIGEGVQLRLGPGKEMGASQIWKAVDDDERALIFSSPGPQTNDIAETS